MARRQRLERTVPRCRCTALSTNKQCEKKADRARHGARSSELTRCHHHEHVPDEHEDASPDTCVQVTVPAGASVRVRGSSVDILAQHEDIEDEEEEESDGEEHPVQAFLASRPRLMGPDPIAASRPYQTHTTASRLTSTNTTPNLADYTALERQISTSDASPVPHMGRRFTTSWRQSTAQSIPLKEDIARRLWTAPNNSQANFAQTRNTSAADATLVDRALLNSFDRLALGEAATRRISEVQQTHTNMLEAQRAEIDELRRLSPHGPAPSGSGAQPGRARSGNNVDWRDV